MFGIAFRRQARENIFSPNKKMTSNSVVSHYFKIPLIEVKYSWKEEAIYFFERQGYKIAYKGDTEYVFRAGSKLGNIISFNLAKVER